MSIMEFTLPQVAHLQAQLALATSEIARLRETFAIAAAAAASTSTANAAAASGALLMAALQPRSPSQTDMTTNTTTSQQPAASRPA